MAVYTEVADGDLTALIDSYGLGQLTSFKGIAEGVENSNYLVQTTSGNYILTLYERRVATADLPFFLGLMDHLAAAGISCPTPLRDRDGRMQREIAGRPAALVTYLDGVWPRRPQVFHCAAVGETLAKLHQAGQDFHIRRANALSFAGWRQLVDTLGADADKVSTGLRSLITDELAALTDQWPRGLPEGVIHADLFPNNVFFLGERLSGVIDFYFACHDLLAYDIAICLNAWCFEGEKDYNLTKAQHLFQGYQRQRPLSAAEIAAMPLLARGAALRFLLTRAHDWLHTKKDALVVRLDPNEYVRKLRFFQRVASPAELGLDPVVAQ